MPRLSTRKINAALVLVGIALFAVALTKMDTEAVLVQLRTAGWSLIPAFPIFVLNLGASTLAWRECTEPSPDGNKPPFWPLLGAFWAGHGVNGVGVAGAGEVIRGTMLSRHVGGQEAIASLVIYGFLNGVVTMTFTVLGPALAIWGLDLPLDIVGAVLAMAVVFTFAMLAIRTALHRGMAGKLVRLASKLPIGKNIDVERLTERAAIVDERVAKFRKRRFGAYVRALLWSAAARLLQISEACIFLYAFLPDKPIWWLFLLGLLTMSASQLIGWIAWFVPGRVGVTEVGVAALYKLVNLGAEVGLSFAVLHRVRRAIGIAVGLGIAAVVEIRAGRRLRRLLLEDDQPQPLTSSPSISESDSL